MNEIKVYKNHEFGEIRTVSIDGDPWLVGRDVALALGYAKPENALVAHVDEEDKTSTLIQGSGSNYKSKVVVINESGLYSLVLSSKLPGAKKFKRWVTSEVLPSIRKHGGYITGQEEMSGEELMAKAKTLACTAYKAGNICHNKRCALCNPYNAQNRCEGCEVVVCKCRLCFAYNRDKC